MMTSDWRCYVVFLFMSTVTTVLCLTLLRAAWGTRTRWWCTRQRQPSFTCPTVQPESWPPLCPVSELFILYWVTHFGKNINSNFVAICLFIILINGRNIILVCQPLIKRTLNVCVLLQCCSSSAALLKLPWGTLQSGPSTRYTVRPFNSQSTAFNFWFRFILMTYTVIPSVSTRWQWNTHQQSQLAIWTLRIWSQTPTAASPPWPSPLCSRPAVRAAWTDSWSRFPHSCLRSQMSSRSGYSQPGLIFLYFIIFYFSLLTCVSSKYLYFIVCMFICVYFYYHRLLWCRPSVPCVRSIPGNTVWWWTSCPTCWEMTWVDQD